MLVGLSQPGTLRAAGIAPGGGPGDVPGGGPVDETPVLAAWFGVAWVSVCGVPGLVFRGAEEEYVHNGNEISVFASELFFCEVPGELMQRGRDAEGFGFGVGVGVSLIDAVGGGVAGVLGAPVCLWLFAADGLAFGLTAGSLAVAWSRIGVEPPQASPARGLPGSGHPYPSAGHWKGQLLASKGGQFLVSAEEPA